MVAHVWRGLNFGWLFIFILGLIALSAQSNKSLKGTLSRDTAPRNFAWRWVFQ